MRRAAGSSIAVAGVVAGVLALAGPGTSGLAAAAASPGASAVTPVTSVPGARPARTVRLATGQLVSVRERNGVFLAGLERAGAARSTPVRTMSYGGHSYVVPLWAQPFVGTVLDRSLFDVTTLPSAATQLTVTAGVAASSVRIPGLTVTARTARTQTGYFTAAGTQQFGRAVAAACARARAAGHVGTLFGGLTSLATPRAVHPVAPHFQQVTLHLKGLDARGRPAQFGDVILVNVDDARKFVGDATILNGSARISVPVGNYSAYYESDSFGRTVAADVVPVAQFRVVTNGQTQVFDARTATSVVSTHVPRSAARDDLGVGWTRAAARGGSVGVGADFGGDGFTVRVAPSGTTTRGTQFWAVSAHYTQNRGAVPYTYDLTFPTRGAITADQSYDLPPAAAATVDARYYTDTISRTAVFGRGAVYPIEGGGFFGLYPLRTPVARTEYVYAPGAIWFDSLVAAPNQFDPFQGDVEDGARRYVAGHRYPADWLRGALAPGLLRPGPADGVVSCTACRTASRLSVSLAPVVDTTPGHYGFFDITTPKATAATFQLYRDGALLVDRRNVVGADVAVPAAAATYRVVDTTYRHEAAQFRTSTTATDDVTFRSAAADPAVPASLRCRDRGRCSALPLLGASLSLPAQDLADVLPVGTSDVPLRVYHAPGSPPIAIRSVKVAVSFRPGIYRSSPVTRTGDGRYTVRLFDPARNVGRPVTTRVTVTDAAGGTLVQTVAAAYYVGTAG